MDSFRYKTKRRPALPFAVNLCMILFKILIPEINATHCLIVMFDEK